MHASFTLLKAIALGKAEEFCLERAKETLDCRIVKAVTFAIHVLLESLTRNHPADTTSSCNASLNQSARSARRGFQAGNATSSVHKPFRLPKRKTLR